MKKWSKHYILIVVFVCVIHLVGCTRTKVIDQISIIHVFGFDQADDGGLIGTALFPDYTKSKEGDQIKYLEEQAQSGVLLGPKMAKHTSTPVDMAKIRVLLFGKNYAEAGIQDMVERFIINPKIGTNIQIAVSTHDARDTLNTFKNEQSLSLAERIQSNMQRQALPNMNLHVFLNHFFGEGMDAYVPMITIDENDLVQIDGMGIFKDDRLKLHLNTEQTTIFSYIQDERTQATYKVQLDESDRKKLITIRAFRSKSKWDWNQKKEEINLDLELQVSLTQFPNEFNVKNPEDLNELKKIIKDQLEKQIGDLLTIFKENEVDPLGIGNIVRSQDKKWDEKSFYEKYSTLPIHVNLKLQILHSGLEG